MGDRASVVFKNGDQVSPVFCDHWGGVELHNAAREFVRTLEPPSHGTPMSRREPGHVLVQFIAKYMPTDSCYLAKDRSEVDDGDEGCAVFSWDEKAGRYKVSMARR